MQVNKKLWSQLGLTYRPAPVKIDSRHIYRRTTDGQLLTGTTTIGKVKDKSFLMFWTVKKMYEYLSSEWNIKKKYTEATKDELLLKGKNIWRGERDESARIGDIIHIFIKCHAQGTDYKKTEEYKAGQELSEEMRKSIKDSIKDFLQWEKDWGVNYLLSEEVVYSDKHNTAGTLDLLAWFSGKKCPPYLLGKIVVIDVKTGGHSEDHALQTAAYKMQLEEQMDIIAKERLIIRIPRLDEKFEVVRIATPYEFDLETFLHLREVHRWNISVENNFMKKDESGYKKFSPNIIYPCKPISTKKVK